jgi:hypothetical protein
MCALAAVLMPIQQTMLAKRCEHGVMQLQLNAIRS